MFVLRSDLRAELSLEVLVGNRAPGVDGYAGTPAATPLLMCHHSGQSQPQLCRYVEDIFSSDPGFVGELRCVVVGVTLRRGGRRLLMIFASDAD